MRKSITMAMCLLALAGVYWFAQAGDLEPSGPPAPTMKTLAQVEPRTPIHASDLPLTITVLQSSGLSAFASISLIPGCGTAF